MFISLSFFPSYPLSLKKWKKKFVSFVPGIALGTKQKLSKHLWNESIYEWRDMVQKKVGYDSLEGSRTFKWLHQ